MASILSVGQLQGLAENSNTITLPAGHTLDASAGGFSTPAGHVIQVVNVESNSAVTSNTAQTYVDIGLSINFTPKSSSSLIIITGHIGANMAASGSTQGFGSKLYIDGVVQTPTQGWYGAGSNVHKFSQFHHNGGASNNDNYVQSPFRRFATGVLTAGTTYTIEHRAGNWNSTANMHFNGGGYVGSTMTITEIAG